MVANNLRQLGLALFEFESEFNEFPSAKTAALVKEATESKLELKGETADDCFRQLIAAGIMAEEVAFEIFSVRLIPEKADPAAKPPKWVFAYDAGGKADGDPRRPLAFYPLVQGKTTFDHGPLGGKAVILFIDNSVRSFPINKEGNVIIDGKDLFNPEQSYFGGKAQDIKWPAK